MNFCCPRFLFLPLFWGIFSVSSAFISTITQHRHMLCIDLRLCLRLGENPRGIRDAQKSTAFQFRDLDSRGKRPSYLKTGEIEV
ncbi:hypothetical protein F5Y01DRAFT_269303 [Xylaria sp. FL0043]|nr:hypothetical protein F5Y01DRAFT_269303 [Xylaria sp. FL0043]